MSATDVPQQRYRRRSRGGAGLPVAEAAGRLCSCEHASPQPGLQRGLPEGCEECALTEQFTGEEKRWMSVENRLGELTSSKELWALSGCLVTRLGVLQKQSPSFRFGTCPVGSLF